MVKVKFCGMTNLDDCIAAVDLSVDFIGFVFYRKSKRYIEPENAKGIIEKLGGKVKTVGVFVEESEEEIKQILNYCRLDFAQTYKEVNVKNSILVYRVKDKLPDDVADGLVLFDSYTDEFGGSGLSFDVRLLKNHHALNRAFIAGGINEHNVYEALTLKPFGIDLVSSIEKYRGKKDISKMENFVKKVRSVEI
jgi:phosphoribosylanthranilate isomerase